MVQRQKPPEETALADREITAPSQGKRNLPVESDPQAETPVAPRTASCSDT